MDRLKIDFRQFEERRDEQDKFQQTEPNVDSYEVH